METEVQNLVAHARWHKPQDLLNNCGASDQLAAFKVYLIHPFPAILHG
jgi:hypothetical protein